MHRNVEYVIDLIQGGEYAYADAPPIEPHWSKSNEIATEQQHPCKEGNK